MFKFNQAKMAIINLIVSGLFYADLFGQCRFEVIPLNKVTNPSIKLYFMVGIIVISLS